MSTLLSARRLHGNEIYDRQGNKLGTIERLAVTTGTSPATTALDYVQDWRQKVDKIPAIAPEVEGGKVGLCSPFRSGYSGLTRLAFYSWTPSWRARAWASGASTTSCVTGSSPASATGASRSRSTSRCRPRVTRARGTPM